MAIASKPTRSASKKASKKPLVQHTVGIADAKAHFPSLVEEVAQSRTSITITKRGKALAMLVPLKKTGPKNLFGCMKGSARIVGDIVAPEPDTWEAMQ